MSSGLSMTSVNKIKELAEAREYSLAVEILDSQNLEASLNPQFLRLCGEVYENVGRYKDARNMYVKAHAMGPESGRIIFSLIRFYLKLGYRKLAELYKDQYIAAVGGSEHEVRKLTYVLEKAKRAPLAELKDYLDPWFIHEMDEEWSFELFLIYHMEGMDTDMLASDYRATFRRSRRSEQISDVLEGKLSAEELFYIYSAEEKEDKDPDEEEIRRFELEQLKKDYDRIHPEEVAERVDEDAVEESEEAEIIDTPDTETKFKSFLKRKFKKKSREEEDESSEASEEEESGSEEAEKAEGEKEDTSELADSEAENPAPEEPQTEQPEEEGSDEKTGQEEETPGDAKEAEENPQPEKKGSWVRNLASTISDRGRNKEEMKELTLDEDAFLSVDFDDGFAAETDSIADLAPSPEEEYENPFDIINAYRIAENESKLFRVPFETRKNEVAEDLPETVEEPAVEEKAAVSLVITEPESEVKEDEPEVTWEEPEEEPESEVTWEEEAEVTWKPEPEAEPEEESAEEPVIEAEPEPEPEAESEPEPEVEEEPEEEPEPEAEEEPEPEPEAEESEKESEPEVEEEPEEEPEPEVEEEPEEEPEPEVEEEPEEEPEPEVEEEPEVEPEPETEEEPAAEPEKEPEPESEFDRKARESNEKLDEGLLEEERLQREAEALLASLGIKL